MEKSRKIIDSGEQEEKHHFALS